MTKRRDKFLEITIGTIKLFQVLKETKVRRKRFQLIPTTNQIFQVFQFTERRGKFLEITMGTIEKFQLRKNRNLRNKKRDMFIWSPRRTRKIKFSQIHKRIKFGK